MKLFEVEAKCGHVGRRYFTLKLFPIKAHSAKEAAAVVRNMPRVKHHHKDAIRSVKEISFDRYTELSLINGRDPYFICKNVQEHRLLVTDCDVYPENEKVKKLKDVSCKAVYKGKMLLRQPKKYFNNYICEDVRCVI